MTRDVGHLGLSGYIKVYPKKTIACAKERHGECLGTRMAKGYPTTDTVMGPCECPCHRDRRDGGLLSNLAVR